jgi:heat-inducible transcriptional repressor
MLIELPLRAQAVLRSIIHHYILTAKPVGSRVISQKYGLGFSSATIRNVMAELEGAGYLCHPHTSAGRIPTPKGYRLYVDNLMKIEQLDAFIKKKIRENVMAVDKNIDFLLEKTSQILGAVSSQLGVVIGPSFEDAVFDRIALVSLSDERLLVVLSLKTGVIKSIFVEVHSAIKQSELEETSRILSERLSGLTVKTIKETIQQRLTDVSSINPELIRLFINSADTFFQFENQKIFIGGTKNIVEQPEFHAQDRVRSIIELIENKNIIVHLVSRAASNEGIAISIGDENSNDLSTMFSIVSTKFAVSGHQGTLGIIGPVRMWYPKIIPLVNYTAEIITQELN